MTQIQLYFLIGFDSNINVWNDRNRYNHYPTFSELTDQGINRQ